MGATGVFSFIKLEYRSELEEKGKVKTKRVYPCQTLLSFWWANTKSPYCQNPVVAFVAKHFQQPDH